MKVAGLAGLASAVSGVGSAEPSTDGRQASKTRPDRRGPVRKSRFIVQIEDIEIPGWYQLELPDTRLSKGEYRNGNEPDQSRQLWGRSDYDPLVMRRGVEPSTAGNSVIPGGGSPAGMKLFDWFKKARQGKVSEARKKITVEILNEAGPQGAPVAQWEFEKAWPIEYSPPNLDASAKGEVAMEELTLAYYKYDRTAP